MCCFRYTSLKGLAIHVTGQPDRFWTALTVNVTLYKCANACCRQTRLHHSVTESTYNTLHSEFLQSVKTYLHTTTKLNPKHTLDKEHTIQKTKTTTIEQNLT